ncbi:MAG: NupC/NupG family nucleoside CNT transporter, partial [Spirochaetota bacterium]|nr:NupC/NupG family nucleoside CNT transporter [Spirochaetota bacterium]
KLAFNVGAILLVFVGLIYLINYLFTMPQPWFGIKKPLTIQGLAGHLFAPITFILGIPWQDSLKAGILLGEKVILNEWIAYDHLAKYLKAGAITQRSGLILSYALCGFANFGSIGIMIGGFSAIAPDKGQELAKLGLKAMLAGLFAGFLTACVAGIIV